MDLAKQVKMLAKKLEKSVSDKEIYIDHRLQSRMQAMSDAVLMHLRHKPNVYIIYDESQGAPVAFTSGSIVQINAANKISNAYELATSRLLALFGILYHEDAHIRFLDFDAENRIINELRVNGTLYGGLDAKNCDDEDVIAEIQDALTDIGMRQMIASIVHSLANIMSDVHDESKMCHMFGGLVERCIIFAAESMRAQAISLESMTDRYKSGTLSGLAVMTSMMLEYARYGGVVIEDDTASYTNEFMDKLIQLAPVIETGCSTDDLEEKYTAINSCLITLWPYIKEVLNSSSSENGQSQIQSAQSSSDAAQQVVQTIKEAVQQATPGSGQAPTLISNQNKSSAKTSSGKSASEMTDEQAQQLAGSIMSQITGDIAQGKAEGEIESELKSNVNAIVQTVNQTSAHAGLTTNIERYHHVSSTDISLYDRIMRDLKPISRALQKQMINAMRDMKDGELQRHRITGSRFEIRDSYRLDGKCFSKKKVPQGVPDMALSVLLDLSGSMSGERIESARKAAMLLYDFADGIGIPIMVSGHTDAGNGINLYIYSDFDKVGDKDKYRLVNVNSHNSCNRDGMAINVVADLLSRRSEEVKLLIVISDGQPNSSNYGGEGAKRDIQSIIKKYKKYGVQVFGAAIGSDKDRIKEIYGDGYIDITNLAGLPKSLTKLVTKRLLSF